MNGMQQIVWPRVAVVIINWNGGKFIRRCLSALSEQTVTPHDIIVLDNASSDQSQEIVRDFPSVRLLAQKENIGFAGGNNLAVSAALPDSEWIVLLNPDAFPTKQWLEKLLLAAFDHPDCAMFGSRLVAAIDPKVIDGEGDVYHISGLAWRERHGHTASDLNNEIKEIFSPCAAAAMYRKSAFLSVGGFDEDYFCYMEDIDLGFRLRLHGYRCFYVPESVVLHMGYATTGNSHSDFSVYYGHRNLVWTYVKNMPGILLWLLLPFHLALNFITLIYFGLKGQGRIILRAKWDALCGVPRMWKKRRAIQQNRKVAVNHIWRLLNKRLIPSRNVLRLDARRNNLV